MGNRFARVWSDVLVLPQVAANRDEIDLTLASGPKTAPESVHEIFATLPRCVQRQPDERTVEVDICEMEDAHASLWIGTQRWRRACAVLLLDERKVGRNIAVPNVRVSRRSARPGP